MMTNIFLNSNYQKNCLLNKIAQVNNIRKKEEEKKKQL